MKAILLMTALLMSFTTMGSDLDIQSKVSQEIAKIDENIKLYSNRSELISRMESNLEELISSVDENKKYITTTQSFFLQLLAVEYPGFVFSGAIGSSAIYLKFYKKWGIRSIGGSNFVVINKKNLVSMHEILVEKAKEQNFDKKIESLKETKQRLEVFLEKNN